MTFLKVQIRESKLVSMRGREIDNLLRHEFTIAARFWHRVIRPKKFTRGAFQLGWGYKRRRRSTNQRKRRQHGHQKPLVKTGKAQKLSESHRIQATRNSFTIFYSSLRVFNFKPRGSEINMRAEFEAVSGRDESRIETRMSRSIERKLNNAARRGGTIRVRS